MRTKPRAPGGAAGALKHRYSVQLRTNVTTDQAAALERVAADFGVSQAHVLRRALETYLATLGTASRPGP